MGYTGGKLEKPTYRRLGDHTESIQIDYDPKRISYERLLEIFWANHNPTRLTGSRQYMPAIFYHNEEQRAIAEKLMSDFDKRHLWQKPIVTELVPAGRFYPAEDYHQKYFSRHPEQAYCQMVISPKLNKFRKQWAKRLNGRSPK